MENLRKSVYPGLLAGFYFGLLLSGGVARSQAVWAKTGLESRHSHAMAYDSARGRTVLFGGIGSGDPTSTTWEWDGNRWESKESKPGPRPRRDHAMAYDPLRKRTVLFGGSDSLGFLGDTWEWDGTIWRTFAPAASPAPRQGHAMAFDAVSGKVLLFGGRGSMGFAGETWEWDGTNWTQRSPAASPPGLEDAAMAAGPNRVVLFGGSNLAGTFGDTWEWDGANWTQANPAAAPPPGMCVMAYDSVRSVTVLFGGAGRNDIWEWDGAVWRQILSGGAPSARFYPAMVFDAARKRCVLFGGTGTLGPLADTWEWDGARWTEPVLPACPPPLYNHAMAFDTVRGVVVLFGGYVWDPVARKDVPLAGTWERSGTTWQERRLAQSPPARAYHGLAFDPGAKRTLLFGGTDGVGQLADTWEWDGTSWLARNPGASPTARSGHALAHDSGRGRTVLFGGWGGTGALDDTWEWDGATWTQLQPVTRPSPRWGHAMAYDAARGRTVLFGEAGAKSGAETWEWDGTNWARWNPSDAPSKRQYHAMAYDPTRGRTVLFGGVSMNPSPHPMDESWEWDGIDWWNTTPASGPTPRWGQSMVFDALRNRIIVFGGHWVITEPYFVSSIGYAETWEYGPTYPAGYTAFGKACGNASLGQIPGQGAWIGSKLGLSLTGATTVLLFGSSELSFGGFPLPLDLGPYGMTGCNLYTNILARVGVVGAICRILVPMDSELVGRTVYVQALVSPYPNPAGLAATGAGRILIGRK